MRERDDDHPVVGEVLVRGGLHVGGRERVVAGVHLVDRLDLARCGDVGGERGCNRFGIVEAVREAVLEVALDRVHPLGVDAVRAEVGEGPLDLVADVPHVGGVLHARENREEFRIPAVGERGEELVHLLLVHDELAGRGRRTG